MTSTAAQLLEQIHSRRARVGVVGLGYVGLPLLTEFARSGAVLRHQHQTTAFAIKTID